MNIQWGAGYNLPASAKPGFSNMILQVKILQEVLVGWTVVLAWVPD